MKHLRLRLFLAVVPLLPLAARAATISLSPTNDTFTRAAVPVGSYGTAGSASVSGPLGVNAAGYTNGVFDSFLRFDTASAVSSLNSPFGGTNWTVTSISLKVTETGAPANTNFNRGVGAFEIRWMANDGWIEGTGSPSAPGSDGLSYSTQGGFLGVGDLSLGVFTNGGTDGLRTFTLGMPAGFIADLRAGNQVSFYLTSVDATTAFTFDTQNFGTPSARPLLEITAVPEPGTVSLHALGMIAIGLELRRRRQVA